MASIAGKMVAGAFLNKKAIISYKLHIYLKRMYRVCLQVSTARLGKSGVQNKSITRYK